MKIISSDDSSFPELYSQFHQQYSPSPYLTFNDIEYCKSYHSDYKFDNYSFLCIEQNIVVACFVASVDRDENNNAHLSAFREYPAFYFERPDLSNSTQKAVNKAVKKHFDSVMTNQPVHTIQVLDSLAKGELNTISLSLLNENDSQATPYFTQLIDLSLNESERKSLLRKSYKSLINWGKNNLEIQVLDSVNICWEDIESIRQLHIEVAGRETRSCKTWEVQYDGIKASEGFAMIGKLDGKLVSASLFFYNQQNCSYAVSVSRRDFFDKPISHALLWEAMAYAQQKGCHYFEMGEQLFPQQGQPTDKELNIARFKRGFGGSCTTKILINK